MVRKGQRGQTKEERDCAAAALDQAIQNMLLELSTKKDQDTPDKELLEKHFTPRQLEALWQRFAKARGRAPQTIRDAWNQLKGLGAKKKSDNHLKALTEFMKDPDSQAWTDVLLSISDEIKGSHRITKEKKGLLSW